MMISEKQAVFEIIIGEMIDDLNSNWEDGRVHIRLMADIYYSYWLWNVFPECKFPRK